MLENNYLESRLEQWADYYMRREDSGLGYPKRSAIVRIGEGSNATSQASPEMNAAAEEIEALVKEMAAENAKWAQALRDKYFSSIAEVPLQSGKKRDVVSRLARKHGISNRMFQVRVKCAKLWLEDKLLKKNIVDVEVSLSMNKQERHAKSLLTSFRVSGVI
jgi:hypothetical protein